MIPAYGVTTHRIQGSTLNKIKIDFGNELLGYGLAAVALSRVRRLEDIMIVGDVDFNRLIDLIFSLSDDGKKTKSDLEAAFSAIRGNIQARFNNENEDDQQINTSVRRNICSSLLTFLTSLIN